MKKYKVIDLQGANFMDDTHEEPMTLNELRERFWSLDEARTEKYSEFTSEYIQDTWLVEFKPVETEKYDWCEKEYELALNILYDLEDKTDYKSKELSRAINILQNLEVKYFCPHCGKEVSTKKKDLSNEDYFGACLDCQEDFYSIELKIKID